MHHVRQIRDLKQKYAEKHIDFWTLQMSAINRKQIPLCKTHHISLHNKTLSVEEATSLCKNIIDFEKNRK